MFCSLNAWVKPSGQNKAICCRSVVPLGGVNGNERAPANENLDVAALEKN